MRELKFRAWDDDAGRFRTDITICDGIAESSWGKEKPEWIVEQFTGLLDKNGKPVFEGDVLKTDEAGWIAKVIWHYDGFMLTGLDNTGVSCSPNYAGCEVIGTIHDAEYKEQAK